MDELGRVSWPGWETVRLIGRGSFGSVYEIQRDVFGDVEKAALKVISIPQNASDIDELYSDGYDDESITSTFQSHLKSIVAEYSLMRKMNGCANIVNCEDIRYVQHDDGIGWDIFIKMELLTPLTKALPSEIPEETIVKVAKDLCTALELCKKHDIVHRDIKPQNIFVSPNGDYKLGDFGIAKTVEKTMGGTKIGTYKYMAPEVYNNEPYGSAADIYSLGLVLYWMLNERRMPFLPLPPEKLKAGMDESARSRRLAGEQLPPPAHGNNELKEIILKACAYDPTKRYSSASEMLRDLNNAFIDPEVLLEREYLRKQREEEEHRRKEYEEQERILREQADKACLRKEQEEQVRIRKQQDECLRKELEIKEILRDTKKTNEPGEPVRPHTKKNSINLGEVKRWLPVAIITVVLIVVIILIFGVGNEKASNTVPNIQTTTSAKVTTTPSVPTDMNPEKHAHQWLPATYTDPMTCSVCGVTEGNPKVRIVAVAAGSNHTVVLREDGTVEAVGYNEYGQCNVSEWTDIVSICAGANYTVGLKRDGTVVAVGENYYGQCDVSGWTDIVAINASWFHTIGVKSDGTVVAVGSNHNGGCDVSRWKNIIMADGTQTGTVGLKKNGSVVCTKYEDLNWKGIKKLATNNYLAIGLKSDGSVVVGMPFENKSNLKSKDLSAFKNIVAVDVGDEYAFGLRSDGSVVTAYFGDQIYDDNVKNTYFPNIFEWTDICLIVAGRAHIVALTGDGRVLAAGDNSSGQCDVQKFS